MNSSLKLLARLTLTCALMTLPGQASAQVLTLEIEAKIPLGNVTGRIDHLAIDRKRQRLFVAELGNDTVAVLDLAKVALQRRLAGLSEPQGIAYEPEGDILYVANGGNGTVHLFQGEEYTPLDKIELGQNADNVRIDSARRRVLVGHSRGALAVI